MTWSKRSGGVFEATCDNCGDGLIGTQEFIEGEDWVVLSDEGKSVCCGDCLDELEEKGMDCPECKNEMDVDTLIHMSKSGPKGVKCFVCECGERFPIGGRVEG